MIKQTLLGATLGLGLATGALAAGGETYVEDFDFSFEGPLGTFDQGQLQRGLQVFTEVCAGCHGLKYVYFRNLGDEGGPHYSDAEVKAYAAQFDIYDADLDDFRSASPQDFFPENVDAGAPDLSLMAKARAGFHGPLGSGINQLVKGMGGPEYIASLLSSYTGEEKEEAGVTLYENTAFPGGWISMAPPLYGDDVEYADGHSTDLKSVSEDVAAFLTWAAEPKMMARKQAGLVAVLWLVGLAALLYLTNKKLWAPIKRKAKA